nr:hypothetical protein CFP56_72111 [Quercus suber]
MIRKVKIQPHIGTPHEKFREVLMQSIIINIKSNELQWELEGQNHHVASVSTSGSVSGLTTEANGVPVAAGVSSSSAHAKSNFIDTMSGNDSFVTPIRVPDFVPNDGNDAFFPSILYVDPTATISDNVIASSLLSADVSPSPSQVPFTAAPSSPPVVPAPPMPLRKAE